MHDSKNILEVAALNPDYMGFIFYRNSKRYVGSNFSIPETLSEKIKRVGVFVDESIENILDEVSRHKLDFVQLHGNESVEMCEKLKDKTKVIKVFRVDELFDFNFTRQFNPCADFFLFDTKGETYGGTGRSFDWKLLRKYNQETPFFLSGGMSTDNIQSLKALDDLNIYGLDFNSRVESEPGIKNMNTLNSIFSILNSF